MQRAIEDLTQMMRRLEARSSTDRLQHLQSNLHQSINSQTEEIVRLADLLENKTKSRNQRAQDNWEESVREASSTHANSLKHTIESLSNLASELKEVKRQEVILCSLQFDQISRRRGAIPKAHEKTLQWIFDGKRTNFVPWLESGSGVYWVNGLVSIAFPLSHQGLTMPAFNQSVARLRMTIANVDPQKAGSGKSTLMKYVSTAKPTLSGLQTWAGDDEIVIASHYFWRAGTVMQKSQQGLFQSLLYHILREVPHMIEKICGNYRNGDVWDIENLKACFGRLVEENLGIKCCLFVDGLDEFEGPEDCEAIIEIVSSLASSKQIKVCTSSRPWTAFAFQWGSSSQQLLVQDFTADDMKLYTRDRLAENSKFKQLSLTDERHRSLVVELSKRSNGIWLWVYLAVRDLLRDIRDNEPFEQLMARLNSYPRELEEYFEDIIRRIDSVHQEQSAQIFVLAYEAARPMSIRMLPALERWQDTDFAMSNKIEAPDPEEITTIFQEWKPRLQNRCRDLVRITSDGRESPVGDYQIDFLHRTVSDFLADHYLEKLKAKIPRGFDPNIFLSKLMLICLKCADVHFFKAHLDYLIAYVDELLVYAWKVEQLPSEVFHPSKEADILDELDRIMQFHSRGEKTHWTNARDPAPNDWHESWREGGQASFLALVTQAHLGRYIEYKLSKDPSLASKKRGRPLLDYALRPERVTPVILHYNYHCDMPWIDPDLVSMLIEKGGDPNAKIRILDDQTPWSLFLLSCRRNWQVWPRETKRCAHESIKILLQAGARSDVTLPVAIKIIEESDWKTHSYAEDRSPDPSRSKATTTTRSQQNVVIERSRNPEARVTIQALFSELFPDEDDRKDLLRMLSTNAQSPTFSRKLFGWLSGSQLQNLK